MFYNHNLMGNEWNIHDYTYIMGKIDIHMFNVSNIMIINNKTIGIKVIIMSCIVRLIS